MKYNENEELIKMKTKKLSIIILSIISITIVLIIIGLYCFSQIFKHREDYYVLEINNSNKETIKLFLENEKNNYCDSMYKIEYNYSFPHSSSITIYCEDSNNIELYTDNYKELIDYLRNNGEKKSR